MQILLHGLCNGFTLLFQDGIDSTSSPSDTNAPAEAVKNLLHIHASEIMILVLFAMIILALLVLVPQLLRAHLHKQEMLHQEHLKALEIGLPVPSIDESTRAAGLTAMLVPTISVICAGTVTCFLVAYRSDSVFSVALAVWSVAGVVGLAAITGGVALIGRLAQLKAGADEELPDNPLQG